MPEPSLTKVKQLVSSGQLRFFLLDGTGARAGAGGFGGRGGGNATVQAVTSWVQSSCTAVPAQDYAASSSSGTGGAGTFGAGALGAAASGGTLYRCGAS